MDPKQKKLEPQVEPETDGDFADEAAPKDTEFDNEADAKDLTAGDFEPIP
jgi:hypothetical protein